MCERAQVVVRYQVTEGNTQAIATWAFVERCAEACPAGQLGDGEVFAALAGQTIATARGDLGETSGRGERQHSVDRVLSVLPLAKGRVRAQGADVSDQRHRVKLSLSVQVSSSVGTPIVADSEKTS